MQLSLIIPTYNNASVVLRSLETWVNQSFPKEEFEVIVVDNNSTDNTAELVQNFIKDKPNFQYVLETKKGSTNARHAGAKLAQADILLFCDDDGLFNPDCVQSILDVYQMNPDVAAVAGKITVEWDKEAPDWIEPYLFMFGQLDYGDEIIFRKDIYLNGGIFSIRKSIFEELGGFNPDLIGDYLVGDGDTGLVIKLHKANKLIGWTPFAEMKHLQFVEKHGTVEGMGRRFFNVGISNTYGFYREQNFKMNVQVLRYRLNSFLFYWKKKLEYMLFKDKKQYFSMMQRKGELQFWRNLRNPQIKREIKYNREL